jgi:hypothetical protein
MAMTLDERFTAMGKRLAAAKIELAERQGFEDDEIADILEWVNDAYEEITHDDEKAAHARYDELEAEMAKAERKLAAPTG